MLGASLHTINPESVLTSCSSDSNVGQPLFEFNVVFLNIPSFQGSSKQLTRPAPSMLSVAWGGSDRLIARFPGAALTRSLSMAGAYDFVNEE